MNKLMEKMMELMPIVPCQVATRLASEAMERNLSLKERFDLWLHLKVCELCVRFVRQVRGLRKVTRRYSLLGEIHLPQESKDKIKQAIRAVGN